MQYPKTQNAGYYSSKSSGIDELQGCGHGNLFVIAVAVDQSVAPLATR